VPEAAQAALQAASPDGVVLVAGSLFLVGEIKKIFDSAKE
jgi:folylpolyglutamate synthase/dihydropteroate synthase